MSELDLAGVVPLSSVDWPDHLVATVFCQGCPWRCPYCQNAAILDTRTPGIVPWADVQELLERRRGLLDGVVFTGGEALRQAAVESAIADVKALGLQVGLHTAGAYPRRLAQVLPDVDWVGLDIKSLPEDYREAAGYEGGTKAWESLAMIVDERRRRVDSASPFTYEVRTTVFPGSPAERHFEELVARIREAGVEDFALQEARAKGTDPIFQAMATHWDMSAWRMRFEEMAACARSAGFSHVEVR
jgi:pyruvate formate lyase activating enzyme